MSILQFAALRTAATCCFAVLVAVTAPAQQGRKGGNRTPPDPVIVFVAIHSRGGTNEIMVADADGGNATTLTSRDYEGFFYPEWSPDLDPSTTGFQGKIVYEYWSGPMSAPPQKDLYTIDVVVGSSNVTGQNETLLLRNAVHPAWSPRGDMVAYVREDTDTGIYILQLPHADPNVHGTQIIANLEPTDPYAWPPDQWVHASSPCWNAAGTEIAFVYSFWDSILQQGFTEIRTKTVVDASGNLITNGAETTVAYESGSWLDWSFDDAWIAYDTGGELRVVEVGAPPDPALATIQVLPDTRWAEHPTWPADRTDVLVFMNRRGDSGSGKRKIVMRDLSTQVETDLVARKGWHLVEPDWRR